MDSKTQVWRYVVPNFKEGEGEPHDRGQWWGIFLLDNSGMFTAVTDAGNYAYCWGYNTGHKDFREFLLDVDKDYVLGKICRKDEYDEVATLAAAKEAIFEADLYGLLGTKTVEDHLKDLSTTYGNLLSNYTFQEWWEEVGNQLGIDPYDIHSQRYPVQASYFFDKIFKRLQIQLRQDLLTNNVIQMTNRVAQGGWC